MTSTDILKANLLDIVFENRNKQYGAYILRKQYNKRLSIALITSLALSLLFFILFKSSNSSFTVHNSPPDIVIKTLPLPKEHLQKPIQPRIPKSVQSTPRVLQQALVNIHITNDPKLINPVPDIRTFDYANVGDHKVDGPVSTTNTTITSGTGDNNNSQATEEKKPFEPIERAPEFPGGMKAWVNFLSKNLETPSQLEAGEKKTVMIRFRVAIDGSVTGFEVVQSAGSIYDNEVIRVLKKMPKWKPAIQNGHIVATSFTQPVTFVGVEQ